MPGGGGCVAVPGFEVLAAVVPRFVGGRDERPVPGGATEEAGRVEGQSSIAPSTWASSLERVCIFSRSALSCSSRDGPPSFRRLSSVSCDMVCGGGAQRRARACRRRPLSGAAWRTHVAERSIDLVGARATSSAPRRRRLRIGAARTMPTDVPAASTRISSPVSTALSR